MLLSAKIAPTFDYRVLQEFWTRADELGFHSIANYDHFYGLIDHTDPTFEGWTSLAAMAVVVRRARVSCLVSGVTYRNYDGGEGGPHQRWPTGFRARRGVA
jgi:alkanesulfonate monooxygenase SsuD/methylene tetrahydromethanopterin reductase-like flavin-dependent oxidoreductase (luciferase family)